MPHDRYFVEASLQPKDRVAIEGEEFHHLSRVMRGSVGDLVECFNGHGVLAETKIISIGKKSAELEVALSKQTPSPQNPLIIAQAYPRQNRLEIGF